jgi:predicted NBD/HSP70 family sugar kinase
VIVENDTNLAAQGEHFCGATQTVKDFVFINIRANVGAGIFLDGKIHHGSQWSAGEIAYLRLPSTSRRQPTIHESGELESVVTNPTRQQYAACLSCFALEISNHALLCPSLAWFSTTSLIRAAVSGASPERF